MNVQDVVNRVKRTFGDDAGTQITDDDILRWINDAQLKISSENEDLLETLATSNIVANQADYAVPSDLNQIRSLMFNNNRIRGLSFAEFNEYLDGFKGNIYGASTPEVFMVYANVITLFPTPSTSITNGLKVYYSRHPASVATLGDSLTVPNRYHNSVVDFCLQQAYEMDENPEMLAFKKGQFDEAVHKLKGQEKVTSSEYYPRITTLPEDDMYWDGY